MKRKALAVALALVMVLAMVPMGASAAGGVTIKKTNIEADEVFNTGGYGSLTLYDDSLEYGDSLIALIDHTGTIRFPYYEMYYGNYYVSDGIVSRVTSSVYSPFFNFKPEYYYLDGTLAFDTSSYGSGTPMLNGYAIMYPPIWKSSYQGPGNPCIIDNTGKIVYIFPDEFADQIVGGDGFLTKYSVGWVREEMIACYCWPDYITWTSVPESIFYVDVNGNKVFSLDGYKDSWPFYEGYAKVLSETTSKYGFIDKTGQLVIPCMYEDSSNFGDGLAGVKKNGKWGYINTKNETVIPFEYDAAYGAGDGLAAVVKDGKCGLVDYDNNIVVPLEYDDISSYEGGAAYAVKDGVIYIITGYSTSPTVTFSPTGGTVSPSSAQTDADGKLTSLPTPDQPYATFDGWYTQTSGGEPVTTDTVFTEDTTIYAHWTYRLSDETGTLGDNQEIAWSFDTESYSVTLNSDSVSETAPVLIAEYDENGRMLGVAVVTQSGKETAVSKQADQVRLFWLDQTNAPKCENAVIGE